ncbi:spoIVB peptidase [Firmicutes bacterium CAG:882]|jgi:stage IV sporulation protein B|nr:spoIVB peptidase [Firmicutes bacterium CAG:882]
MEKVCDEFKKTYRHFLIWLLIAGIAGSAAFYIYAVKNQIPDTINLNRYADEKLDFNIPFVGTVEQTADTDVSEVARAYATNVKAVNVNLLDTLNISTGEIGSYDLNFRLFGMVTLKSVKINVCDEVLIIPCGIPVGIYIETKGVMVVDIGDITTADGTVKCPASDILWPGDYIVSVNGQSVDDKEALIEAIDSSEQSAGEYVNIGLYRNGRYIEVRLEPVRDENGRLKIGTWVRDDCQGLGTLTYIDKNGRFGALGHGISDIDTGKLVNSEGGRLYCARIWSIVKGKAGTPGEVVGSINYSPDYFLGFIESNSDIGIYGVCDENIYQYIDSYALPVVYKQSVQKGMAYIRSFIDGTVRDYAIYITDIDMSNGNINKGISFTVTDEALLESTGGIIQGMSGSPIIQNGGVIGAVTHVLVNDPAKGYGIFIEDMLEH